MKAAIYARVSSIMQAEEEIPILGQIQECQSVAQYKGWVDSQSLYLRARKQSPTGFAHECLYISQAPPSVYYLTKRDIIHIIDILSTLWGINHDNTYI